MTLATAGLPIRKNRTVIAFQNRFDKPESTLVIYRLLLAVRVKYLIVTELPGRGVSLLDEAGSRSLVDRHDTLTLYKRHFKMLG